MKGVESKNGSPNNMFAKLQQHHHNQAFSHHFQLSRQSQTLDSDDTATPAGPKVPSTNQNSTLPSGGSGGGGTSAGDGATIEVVRRPRGRPPGSKNRPKPPVLVAREPNPAMSPYILEIPGGNDVVEAISRFSGRKNIGICVLTGSGTVSNVTLRQPSSTPGGIVTFHGRFDILSLSATVLPPTTSYHVPNTFSISLAGPQGRIVGGFVAGSLIAAGTVFIVAATFNNPSHHHLPGEEETTNKMSSGGDGEGQSPPISGGGGDSAHGAGGGSDSCGVSMFSSHFAGSDVIWAPNARPPPPPPPY